MALKMIEIFDGKYLYRCEFCPFEHPDKPTKKHELGNPPAQTCKPSTEAENSIMF